MYIVVRSGTLWYAVVRSERGERGERSCTRWKVWPTYFRRFLNGLQFIDLQGTFWPLKGPTFIVLPYFELKVV